MRPVLIGACVVLSAVATFIIMQVPDDGAKITLFAAFGMAFGIPWAMSNIRVAVVGLMAGALLGVTVVFMGAIQADLAGQDAALIGLLRWALPILFYTAEFSLPSLAGDG